MTVVLPVVFSSICFGVRHGVMLARVAAVGIIGTARGDA